MIEILGKGSFGETYRCTKGGVEYAIKQINHSAFSSASASGFNMEEYYANNISAKVKSKFLVQCYEAFTGPHGRLFVVMELCTKGDLRTLIARCHALSDQGIVLSPTRITRILIQLLLGLEVLHSNNILHRDLKPANVFMDEDNNVKIGDFGCVRELDFSLQKVRTPVGTPLYQSPEVLEGKEYGSSSDMWSLGVLLYEMCMLAPPFDGSSFTNLLASVKAAKYKRIPSSYGDIAHIVYSLLTPDPRKRPSAGKLLQTPFILKSAEKHKLLKYFSHE